MEEKRDNSEDWDFRGANTNEFTHCMHTYPAMMIPQIARKLILLYGPNAKTLLDPFCGSGTSLVEASLTDNIKEAHGFDLNPLAVLISKVKTTSIDQSILERAFDKLMTSRPNADPPTFKNIEFWFKPKVIQELAILKTAINNIKNKDVRDFFLVCFSEAVRDVSNTRNSEFKLYRIAKDKLEGYNPEVRLKFEKIVRNNIKGMEDYTDSRKNTNVSQKYFSSMDRLPLSKGSIDIIVTSPPYGDSRTTVAYGQFSRLASEWLDYENIRNLDSQLLGGRPSKGLNVGLKSPTLKEIIEKIAKHDEKRAKEVLSFYEDFDKCVKQLDNVLSKEGYVCFVVGNRTVKGINIPTDIIMVEMFKAHGDYEHIVTHLREIPNKRMPKQNSPSNKKGQKITTMNNEFIFILRKK
jgi:site-specific DNA-methyltransferase (cytosine-N4-specific)